MKKSIKWRITVTFILVVSLVIGAILFFNTLMIDTIYLNKRVEVLKKTYELLDEGVMDAYQKGYRLNDIFKNINKIDSRKKNATVKSFSENFDDFFLNFLNSMQDRYNVSIALADSENNCYSLFRNTNEINNRIKYYIFRKEENKKELNTIFETKQYAISVYNNIQNRPYNNQSRMVRQDDISSTLFLDNLSNAPMRERRQGDLESFGFLSDNETAFLMTTPIISMTESKTIFNNVLIMLSLIAIFIGSIVIYFTSYKITEPIKELANLSTKMSNLEFDSKYTGNRIDEIGILGNSMNEMNKKLETTIKDLKNANIKLQNDIEQKEKLDEMRKEFVSNVSHELKTPIALIQGYAEGLQCGMAKTDEDKDYYTNVIIEEAGKMNKMVRQLLELSSLERDADDMDLNRINLSELVRQVIGAQEIVIEQKEIDISIEIDDKIFVWADEFKLEEVVRNYFTNAINHIDDNKLIKIYTQSIYDDKIRLFVYNSGEQLSNENLTRIWEKFYKTDKARTRAYGGTGLGLSIVKIIADKHKTECGCENVDENDKLGLKKGIVFYFDLYTK